jgi:hypothetical protein
MSPDVVRLSIPRLVEMPITLTRELLVGLP